MLRTEDDRAWAGATMLVCLLGLALTVPANAQLVAQSSPRETPTRSASLAAVKSWGYQLQNIEVERIAASSVDLVVIDGSRDGKGWRPFSPAELTRMKTKPDGSRRIVLGYMSIGEAETYRFYWQKRWAWMGWTGWRWVWQLFGDRFVPSWLGPENKDWRGNYGVRYWQPSWQAIILDGSDSYLARLLAAGFDGVFLDKVDEFQDMESERRGARAEMIAFVKRIAETARARDRSFLVIPQNGEELLADASYRATIDGLGKEDLFFGDPKDGVRNSADAIAKSRQHLSLLTADRKPVFAVEYLRDPALITAARKELEAQAFVPLFADRALDRLRRGDLADGAQEGGR